MAYTSDPAKKWTLRHVLDVAQWEDPCPFWDDDGKAYLVRSKLCGGPAILHRMSDDGLSILDKGKIVYQDEKANPVLEGLKIMKRNNWYYILAPAGGVANGWQTVLRSRNIEGPYEARVVLSEGNGVNGPHQGGFVDTPTGEWWFVHFQDKGVYGRILHLQPGGWQDDWPVMGIDGKPVLTHKKPDVGRSYPIVTPQTTDEFQSRKLGLQWQWQATGRPEWYSLKAAKGCIRLYAASCPEEDGNLYYAGNLLLQKLPAPAFTSTAKMNVARLREGERGGLVMMGNRYTYLAVEQKDGVRHLVVAEGMVDNCGYTPQTLHSVACPHDDVWLRVTVNADATCNYSYSTDGEHFSDLGGRYALSKGQWIGAKVGLFCINPDVKDGRGFVDVDYFRVTP